MAGLGAHVLCSRQNIHEFETGQRACGPVLAEKLARALKLDGNERVDFLLQSAATTERGKAPEIPGVGDSLVSYFKQCLSEMGIQPDKIVAVQLTKREPMDISPDIVITDKNGVRYFIELKVKKI